jgi:hypothetical protein
MQLQPGLLKYIEDQQVQELLQALTQPVYQAPRDGQEKEELIKQPFLRCLSACSDFMLRHH